MKVSKEQFFIISKNKIIKVKKNHQVLKLRTTQHTNIQLSYRTTAALDCRYQKHRWVQKDDVSPWWRRMYRNHC